MDSMTVKLPERAHDCTSTQATRQSPEDTTSTQGWILEDRICDRCMVMTRKPFAWEGVLFMIKETAEQLAVKDCAMCRTFCVAILEHQENSYVGEIWEPTVTLRLPAAISRSYAYVDMFYHGRNGGMERTLNVRYLESTEQRKRSLCTTAQRVAYEVVEGWMDQCRTHERCQLRSSLTVQGLKLINCVSRIIEEVSEPCKYVALSYVWGKPEEGSFTVGDSVAKHGSILPKTIEDSLMVTRKLGYQYTWIDRYCIDQGSLEDKQLQIGQMGAIYTNADLTIIAAAGEDPSYGLPGVSSDRKVPATSMIAGPVHVVSQDWKIDEDIESCKWSSRAWTLQESYLSRKRLFFTDREVVFMCDTNTNFEKTHPEPTLFSLKGLARARWSVDLVDSALWLIRAYSKRQMTHQSDALHAITGALNTLTGDEMEIFHLWGVLYTEPEPEGTELNICLDWYSREQSIRRCDFPSWSPLGWRTSVENDRFGVVDCLVKVWTGLSYCAFDTLTTEQLRSLRSSTTAESKCLEITAFLFQLRVRRIRGIDPETRRRYDKLACIFECEGLKVNLVPYWNIDTTQVELVGLVQCALLRKCQHGLLLMPKGDGYERIGTLDINAHDGFYIQQEDGRLRWPSGDELDGVRNLLQPGNGTFSMIQETFLLV